MLSIILLGSCTHDNNTKSAEDEEYNHILAMAQPLYVEGNTRPYFHFVDSMFALKRHISVYGLYMRYATLAYDYNRRNISDSAMIYADSALNILEKEKATQKYPTEYVHALLEKANTFFKQGKYSLAYEYYYRAKETPQAKTGKGAIGDYDYCIAMTLYRQRKYREAANEFKEGFTIALTCDPHGNRLQELLSNVALCYTKLNMLDTAAFYYDSALVYIEKSRPFNPVVISEAAKGVVYGNIATLYFNRNSLDTAEALMKKSIAINLQPAYENMDAQKTEIRLANLYYRKKEYPQMWAVLTDLRRSLDTLKDKEVDANWKRLMYQYYEVTGQPVKSCEYYRDYITSKDSLDANDKERFQTDVMSEINDKDRLYQISLLKKDKQFSNIVLVVAIVFSVLVLAIVALVYAGYKRSRKANVLISDQKAALEKSNAEKDRILNVVAHDLRSPVGSALYVTDMLLREDGSPMDQKTSLRLMKDALSGSLSLINELLALSAEGKSFEKKETDITPVITEAVRMLQYKATEKKQVISVNVPPVPVPALINEEKMSRVMNNLISNAIKFSKEGASVKVAVAKQAHSVLISVSDNGIGIPEDMQAGLFDTFTTSKRTGTGGETSYGLGLSICKQIVALHNGKIWVESTEGKGATFFIELPVS